MPHTCNMESEHRSTPITIDTYIKAQCEYTCIVRDIRVCVYTILPSVQMNRACPVDINWPCPYDMKPAPMAQRFEA